MNTIYIYSAGTDTSKRPATFTYGRKTGILCKLSRWLDKKFGGLEPYREDTRTQYHMYQYEVSSQKLRYILRKEMHEVEARGFKPDCIILGEEALSTLKMEISYPISFCMPTEWIKDMPLFEGVEIRCVPWFKGVLVVPKT